MCGASPSERTTRRRGATWRTTTRSSGATPMRFGFSKNFRTIRSTSAGARRRIAVIAHAAGRRSEAHTILSDLLKRNPADAEALTTRARLLLERSDSSTKRWTSAKSAAQADPRSAPAHVDPWPCAGCPRRSRAGPPRAQPSRSRWIHTRWTHRLALAEPSSFRRRSRLRGRACARGDRSASRQPRGDDCCSAVPFFVRPEDRANARANAEAIVRDFPRSARRPPRARRVLSRRRR